MKVRCIENDVDKLVQDGVLSASIGGPPWFWKDELKIGEEHIVYGIVKIRKPLSLVKGDEYHYLTCINNHIFWRPAVFFEVSDPYLGLEWYYNSSFSEAAKKIINLEFILGYKELATDPNLDHYIRTVDGNNWEDIFNKRKAEFDEYDSFPR